MLALGEQVGSKNHTTLLLPPASGRAENLPKAVTAEWESLCNAGNEFCCGIVCVVFPSRR